MQVTTRSTVGGIECILRFVRVCSSDLGVETVEEGEERGISKERPVQSIG